MDGVRVKEELLEQLQHYLHSNANRREFRGEEVDVIDLGSSSDSDSEAPSSTSGELGAGISGKRSRVSSDGDGIRKKKKKSDGDDGGGGVVLPDGFLDPLPPRETALPHVNGNGGRTEVETVRGSCKQFWKAGDFAEGVTGGDWDKSGGSMDHVRVHPRFLHSNATSHKWVLGAFAELLDNSLDEICNGATYVNVGMVKNKKDGNRMLLIEDNGGGMDPDKMRQCMSLGYSLKSKVADTIGQYGNGFKTSTMRLGADVIVFSKCSGKHGKRSTQSIGMLSYTFLRSTGKEDIVVPMLDYEKNARGWKKIIRSTDADWNRNVEAVVQWSPFSSETELLRQFEQMKDQGTRIIIFNLWEDDQGQLELDFDADPHDIQIRGVNRDEKSIQMAQQFPNSRHFLTYRHSLRSYASILYLRIPPGFRIILRGIDVEHHNIVNDMMLTKEVTYRPQPGTEGLPKDSNMVAVVTMGFVKDAKSHIDVQGFNVYHKNRLIKPFWRLWNAAGSDGRGVIGVLEANFVEPAHDKQGFERTIVLSRLETRLIQMQKTYWSSYCHKIGYAPRRNKKNPDEREYSPDFLETSSSSKKKSAASNGKIPVSSSDKFSTHTRHRQGQHALGGNSATAVNGKGHLYGKGENGKRTPTKSGIAAHSSEPSPHAENISDDELQTAMPDKRHENGISEKYTSPQKSISRDHSSTLRRPPNIAHSEVDIDCSTGERAFQIVTRSQSKGQEFSKNERGPSEGSNPAVDQLIEENRVLKEMLRRKEEEILGDLLHDLERERERCKSLEAELQEARKQIEDLNKEQDSLVDIFSEERERRDNEEDSLRKKLKDASTTIQELVEKVRLLEKMKTPSSKLAR